MAYFYASLIAIISAMVLLLTRFEADDSAFHSEIQKVQTMIKAVNTFSNTYIETGESLNTISVTSLNDAGILLSNSIVNINIVDSNKSTFRFANNNIHWQIIPNINNTSSYMFLVDFRQNAALMSKAVFSESFIGREYCENMLFADFETNFDSYNDITLTFENVVGTKDDGLFVCIVYK